MIKTEIEERLAGLRKHDGYYMIDGCAVGPRGIQGRFDKLIEDILADTSDEIMFRDMLSSDNTAMRVIGLTCLSECGYKFDILEGDTASIYLQLFGCRVEESTVEEYSKLLFRKINPEAQ